MESWRSFPHPDFPRPDRDDGQQPLFDSEIMAEWLDRRPIAGAQKRPFSYGDQFRDGLRMRALAALRGLLPGDALLAASLALAALRHISGGPLTELAPAQMQEPRPPELAGAFTPDPAKSSPEDTVLLTLALMKARRAEEARPELAGVFILDLTKLPQGQETAALVITVEKMCSPGNAADVAADKAAGTAERLIAEADRLGSGIRASMTPPGVAEFIAGIAGDIAGRTVYDPAAGSGTLLLSLIRGTRPARVVAADVNPGMLRLLRQRFLCHDIPVECIMQDSPRSPRRPGVDLVVVDPPFTGSDVTGSDERRQAEGKLLRWLGHAMDQLVPGGQAFVLVPTWLLTRTGEGDRLARRRDFLVKQGAVRAVIQLHRLAHSFRTGAELAILVLGRPLPGEARKTILLCNTTRAADDGAGVARALRERLAGLTSTLPADVADDIPLDSTGWQRSLLPAHVLASTPTIRGHAQRIAVAGRRLDRAHGTEPVEPPPVAELATPRRHISIGECISSRRLRVLTGYRVPAHDIGPSGDVVIIGEPELTGRCAPGDRRVPGSVLDGIRRAKLTSRGDLVMLPVVPLRVMVDTTGGALVQSPAKIMRILPKIPNGLRSDDSPADRWITPAVLAAMLTAPRNAARASGSRVLQDDLEALELPDLPPAEVDRLDEVLRTLAGDRQRTIRRLAALDELTEAVTAGVADGVLSVIGDRPVSRSAGTDDERGPGGTT
jgi:hypothetical protein